MKACFGSAVKLGFSENVVVFLRGYSAGFKDLTIKQQDELVQSYVIARGGKYNTNKLVWAEYVEYFLEDMTEEQKEKHRKIAARS